MKDKHICPDCKVEQEEGFLSDGNSLIVWSKGKATLWRSIFSKVNPVTSYSCPNCGRMDFFRKIKKKK